MMRKYTVLFLIIIFSCKKEESKINLVGYYFSKNKIEFYHFIPNHLTTYNFLDSVVTKSNFEVGKEFIKIKNKSYKYDYYKDSIVIYDFKERNKHFSLQRFDYKKLDMKNLDKTEWQLIDKNKTSVSAFIRIVNRSGIMNFFKYINDTNTYVSPSQSYVGDVFGFNFFSGPNICSIVNLKSDTLSIIYSSVRGEKSIIHSFKKINTSSIKRVLFGKWKKIKDTIFQNELVRNSYLYPKRNFLKRESVNKDSIKKIIDFSNIEFTKEGYLIRSIESVNDSLQVKTKISYNPFTNYIFINNLNFIKEKSYSFPEEQQHFIILKLTKDTLKVTISKPYFQYTYIRKH